MAPITADIRLMIKDKRRDFVHDDLRKSLIVTVSIAIMKINIIPRVLVKRSIVSVA